MKLGQFLALTVFRKIRYKRFQLDVASFFYTFYFKLGVISANWSFHGSCKFQVQKQVRKIVTGKNRYKRFQLDVASFFYTIYFKLVDLSPCFN